MSRENPPQIGYKTHILIRLRASGTHGHHLPLAAHAAPSAVQDRLAAARTRATTLFCYARNNSHVAQSFVASGSARGRTGPLGSR